MAPYSNRVSVEKKTHKLEFSYLYIKETAELNYRILIRNVNINIISFNWLLVGKTPWETEDRQEALGKYHELLDSYSSSDLTLVQVVPVNISVTSDEPEEPCEPEEPEEGGETEVPEPPPIEPPEETNENP